MKIIFEESKIDTLRRMHAQLGVISDFLQYHEFELEKQTVIEIQKSLIVLKSSFDDTPNEAVIEGIRSNISTMLLLLRKTLFNEKEVRYIQAYICSFHDCFNNFLKPLDTKKKV